MVNRGLEVIAAPDFSLVKDKAVLSLDNVLASFLSDSEEPTTVFTNSLVHLADQTQIVEGGVVVLDFLVVRFSEGVTLVAGVD